MKDSMKPHPEVFSEEDANSYYTVLTQLVRTPPSPDSIDPSLIEKTREFISGAPRSPVEIWNFYKELLDLMVHGASGSGFMLRLFQLEPFFLPPEDPGAFSHVANNMDQAPWRKRI